MSKLLSVNSHNGPTLFVLTRLSAPVNPGDFECPIDEYNEYLIEEALRTQEEFIATTDADIEHDPNVATFYTKNGFIPNNELNNKRSKTLRDKFPNKPLRPFCV